PEPSPEPSRPGRRKGGEIPFTDLEPDEAPEGVSHHAAGTPGGGEALGGLAGSTIGRGDPPEAGLEEGMGGGEVDTPLRGEEGQTGASGGRSGGAVGGPPANKRSVGGKPRRGLAPRDPGDSPTGS